MKIFARLLPVPGASSTRHALTAFCLLAVTSLLGACGGEGTPLANNPSGSSSAKKAAGGGDPGDDFPITDPPKPPKATGKPARGRQAVGRSEFERDAACQQHPRQGA